MRTFDFLRNGRAGRPITAGPAPVTTRPALRRLHPGDPRLVIPALLALLAAAGPAPPARAQEEPPTPVVTTLPVHFDFGSLNRWSPGDIPVMAETRYPGYAWCEGVVRNTIFTDQKDNVKADAVQGHDATFLMAIDPPDARCEVLLLVGDGRRATGPFDILAGDEVIQPDVTTAPGEYRELRLRARARSGRLGLRFRGRDCAIFSVAGFELRGPAGARIATLGPAVATGAIVPPPGELKPLDRAARLALLDRYGRHLMERRPRDGGFSFCGAWYQNAYPIRALLAGSRLLDRPEWRTAAFEVLDRFLRARRARGAWYSSYFGPDGCPAGADTTTANLADLGTMALCLSLASLDADPARASAYRQAVEQYTDTFVLPSQLESGAFANGLWQGEHLPHPYSVATATQATQLFGLYAATGKGRYLVSAERAARWLAGNVQEDGRTMFFPHNAPAGELRDPRSVGDLFYVMEALTWARRYARDDETRAEVEVAMIHYFWGSNGLANVANFGYWFPAVPGNGWATSKLPGMLAVLTQAPPGPAEDSLSNWIDRIVSWFGASELSATIGIDVPPEGPTGEYTLFATGLAAMGLAAVLDPAAVFPPPPDGPR